MVIDPEPKEVTLSYAGQEVEITSASVGFVNERQKVEISLQKLLEQDETFSIGMNEEWKNITFGLFAAEAVSYTHLDVYKRQSIAGPKIKPAAKAPTT